MRRIFSPALFFLILAVFMGLVMIEKCRPDTGMYSWEKKNQTYFLTSGGEDIGFLSTAEPTGIRIRDRIEPLGEGIFRITRTCTNGADQTLDSVRLTLDFVHADSARFLMIPAVSYQGNLWGRGLEPKGYRRDGTWWSFSYTRTAIPGATYSEGSRWAVALWGQSGDTLKAFSCSLMPEAVKTTHRLIWPEEELPLSYINRDTYGPGFRKRLTLDPGQSVTISGILVVAPVRPEHGAMKIFLQEAWNRIPHPQIPVRPTDSVWNLAVGFIQNNLWAEEGVFKGFSIGLWLRDGKWIQRPGWKYEIGWAGQNISTANSLLVDYLKNGNRLSLDHAMACLDTWATYAPLPNGLIRNHFDYILGIEKGEEVLDACNLGDAAADYLIAYDLARKCGYDRENFKSIALGICNFLQNDQQPTGQYGKGWDKEGKCLYRDGTVGAFIIPAMVRAYRLTGEKSYLASARRAYDFYFNDFAESGFTSAGALDTWCIDKESSFPMLRSALMLFDATSDSTYLRKAEKTSWYLSSWMWHYSIEYPDSTDFRKYGYDTFGGTAVSTQHHHLDPFGLALVPEWLKLARLTGNGIWREKALAAWANANQVVASGTDVVHGVVRPAGSQTEAYFQTRWGGKPGYFADWMVLWPSAFRLEALRNLEEYGIGTGDLNQQ